MGHNGDLELIFDNSQLRAIIPTKLRSDKAREVAWGKECRGEL